MTRSRRRQWQQALLQLVFAVALLMLMLSIGGWMLIPAAGALVLVALSALEVVWLAQRTHGYEEPS